MAYGDDIYTTIVIDGNQIRYNIQNIYSDFDTVSRSRTPRVPTVFLAKDRVLPALSQEWVDQLYLGWIETPRNRRRSVNPSFFDYAHAFGTGDLSVCSQCAQPILDAVVQNDGTGLAYCNTCIANMPACMLCEVKSYNLFNITLDRRACTKCRDEHFIYCDRCGIYYPAGDEAEDLAHAHLQGCKCEAPHTDFRMRVDGHEEPLENDKRITIHLPAGEVDDEGLRLIRYRLADYDIEANEILDGMERAWQTKRGNFTRRLSRELFNRDKTKLSPDLLSQLGNIFNEHTSQTADFHIEITRKLNQRPAQFGNSGSCWWQSWTKARCALKNNGGFGIRTFVSPESKQVAGRTWVMPVKLVNGALLPTFNSENADAYLVFNEYGNLGGYTAARLVSHMVGMTYRKSHLASEGMYFNSGSGYLVAPQEICSKFAEVLLPAIDHHAALAAQEEREGIIASVRVA